MWALTVASRHHRDFVWYVGAATFTVCTAYAMTLLTH